MDIKEIKYDFIKERLFFDNARAILILLVVFGHMLQPYTSGDKYLSALYLVIYSFHMPTFCLYLVISRKILINHTI